MRFCPQPLLLAGSLIILVGCASSPSPEPENGPGSSPAPVSSAGVETSRPVPTAGPRPAQPCKVGGAGNSVVDRACNEGGVPAAKDVMKSLVGRARAAGTTFQCDDCHADPEDYSRLAPAARDRFKLLIEAAGK